MVFWQTLCQLDMILADKQMAPAPNPTRSIMPSELRSITDSSARSQRDFRVLKEYVNALEYFVDGFNYIAVVTKRSSL